MIRVGALLLAVSMLFSARASAESEEDLARARAHFDIGLGLYNLGNYRDALKEFSAGYQLSPRPKFLVNIGQSYRRLREFEQAKLTFQRYLAEAPPDDASRPAVKQLIADIESAQAASPPTPAIPQAATPAGSPIVTSALSTESALPAHRSFARRYWWVIAVGVAVVGAAVGTAVYFAVRPDAQVSCTDATIGCLDLRH